ncbi:MAG: Fur family transcriptional regulator [Anaerohalosphaeraceae bacterium]
MSQEQIQKLKEYARAHNLRWTDQRQTITNILFGARQHLTTEELFHKAKAKDPAIGYATVSRTLHLLTEAGFCERIDFSDGSMRYEVSIGRTHHDHLVCTQCGKFIEVLARNWRRFRLIWFGSMAFLRSTINCRSLVYVKSAIIKHPIRIHFAE